jgi:hypothetical protein
MGGQYDYDSYKKKIRDFGKVREHLCWLLFLPVRLHIHTIVIIK